MKRIVSNPLNCWNNKQLAFFASVNFSKDKLNCSFLSFFEALVNIFNLKTWVHYYVSLLKRLGAFRFSLILAFAIICADSLLQILLAYYFHEPLDIADVKQRLYNQKLLNIKKAKFSSKRLLFYYALLLILLLICFFTGI